MNKKLKKLAKSTLLFLITMMTFATLMSEVKAVPQTITLGQAEAVPGYVGGTYFTTKTTTTGKYLYCLDLHKDTAANAQANLVGQRDAGIAYILENGYPNKSYTGDRLKDYYITQTAVWWYLDRTTGSQNLGESFKSTGSDPHNLRPTIKKLVNNAITKKKAGYKSAKSSLTISVNDKEMTLKNGYYVSNAISATKYNNIDNYTISVENAPAGTQIVDASGKTVKQVNAKQKFRIKVPASKVKGTKLNIKVKAEATSKIYKAYEYQPVDSKMQNVALLLPENSNVSSSINLSIKTSKINIIKLDKKTNQPLAGAKLVLRDASGKTITTWTSTVNPHAIQNLSNGTYTVVEEKAPKGYKLNTEPVSFTVTDSNKNVTVKFYNEAKSKVVNIIKIDKSTGDPLAGAILVVRDSEGKEITRFTTTTDPYIITDLADGTYTVEEESAPAGYMLNPEKITFTIDDKNLSHQITFENYPEVSVPDTNTKSTSSLLLTLLGIAIIGTGIGFVYKNGKKTQ